MLATARPSCILCDLRSALCLVAATALRVWDNILTSDETKIRSRETRSDEMRYEHTLIAPAQHKRSIDSSWSHETCCCSAAFRFRLARRASRTLPRRADREPRDR